MTWLAAGLEGFDDEHAAAAAGGMAARVAASDRVSLVCSAAGWARFKSLCAVSIVLARLALAITGRRADAVEALGQDVDEKAADELVDSQRGCFECSQ